MTMQGISERAMRELAGVNAAFISVVTMDDAERRGGFGLADEIISRLRLLDDESRRRMAYRPFALFTLNFRDSAGWKQLVEQRVDRIDARGPVGHRRRETQPLGVGQGELQQLLEDGRLLVAWTRFPAGGDAETQLIRQAARTSVRIMPPRDPWVNLLRTTMAAFAAIVGGADALASATAGS